MEVFGRQVLTEGDPTDYVREKCWQISASAVRDYRRKVRKWRVAARSQGLRRTAPYNSTCSEIFSASSTSMPR